MIEIYNNFFLTFFLTRFIDIISSYIFLLKSSNIFMRKGIWKSKQQQSEPLIPFQNSITELRKDV